MEYTFKNTQDTRLIILKLNEDKLEVYFSDTTDDSSICSITWNMGNKQIVTIDEIAYESEADSILPIMMSQPFRLQHPEDIFLW